MAEISRPTGMKFVQYVEAIRSLKRCLLMGIALVSLASLALAPMLAQSAVAGPAISPIQSLLNSWIETHGVTRLDSGIFIVNEDEQFVARIQAAWDAIIDSELGRQWKWNLLHHEIVPDIDGSRSNLLFVQGIEAKLIFFRSGESSVVAANPTAAQTGFGSAVVAGIQDEYLHTYYTTYPHKVDQIAVRQLDVELLNVGIHADRNILGGAKVGEVTKVGAGFQPGIEESVVFGYGQEEVQIKALRRSAVTSYAFTKKARPKFFKFGPKTKPIPDPKLEAGLYDYEPASAAEARISENQYLQAIEEPLRSSVNDRAPPFVIVGNRNPTSIDLPDRANPDEVFVRWEPLPDSKKMKAVKELGRDEFSEEGFFMCPVP